MVVKKRKIKSVPKGTKKQDVTVPALLATTGVTTGTSIGCGIALAFALKENKKLKEQIKDMETTADKPGSIMSLLNKPSPLTDDVKKLQRMYKEEQTRVSDLLKEKNDFLKEREENKRRRSKLIQERDVYKQNLNLCDKANKEWEKEYKKLGAEKEDFFNQIRQITNNKEENITYDTVAKKLKDSIQIIANKEKTISTLSR